MQTIIVPLEFEKLRETKLVKFLILVESLWKYGRKLFGDGTKLVVTGRYQKNAIFQGNRGKARNS